MRPNEVTSAPGAKNEELRFALLRNAFIQIEAFRKESLPTLFTIHYSLFIKNSPQENF